MLLDRLRIEAFRGIRNSIELSLDASITILFASNGTAKTSVCDAAEWLLTGRVRRLRPGLISGTTIQNRYAINARAVVRATATWSNITHDIERTEPELLQIPDANGNIGKPTTTAKFLEQLTPEYVGQTSRSRNVEEPRAEWLRAVRFFSPEGLSLLLDDGEDAERVRAIAFAELLGVGPVGRRIQGLKGVRAQIDSPRAAIANVLEKIAQHETRLKADQVSVSGPYLTRVDTLLREVASFCNLSLPEALISRREVLLSLRDRIASLERALESQKVDYTKVKDSFPQYEAGLITLKQWSEQQKPILEKRLLDSRKERDDLNREIGQISASTSEFRNRLAQLNILLGQTQTAIGMVNLDASSHDTTANLTVGQTRAACGEAEQKEKEAHAQLERWKRFAEQFPNEQRSFLQLDILEKQRLELLQSIPSAEDQEAVERRLRESTLSLTELRAQLNASTDRWQRWGAEVKAQAPNWVQQSDCPLCGFDHQTPEELRSAIDRVLSRQPSGDPDSTNRLAQLESTIAELRTSAATIAERRRQLLELERKIAKQKETFARFLVAVQEHGFDEQIFTRIDASEVIASRIRTAEEAATGALKLASELSGLAADVERWHDHLRNTAETLRAALPSRPVNDESLPADPSLRDRFRSIEAMLAFARTDAEIVRGQAENATVTLEQMRAKLPAVEATIRRVQEDWQPSMKNADETRRFIENIEESWRAISVEPLESTALVRVAASQQQRFDQLHEQSERLTQADQHLALAEQAMRKEADLNESGKAIAVLKTEHTALLRVELLRTKLDSTIEQAEQHLNRLLSTQIRPLLRSISSLYLRTQGNAFIDSIGVDENPTRNVLRWLGQLVDAKPLSAVEMSQGQRQDLALSIFLARARRERGTFILDEPLAHLDDLNRVAFFDTLRAMIAETVNQQPLRLLITTASTSLVRHLRAKFCHLREANGSPAFRALELVGDPRGDIEIRDSS